MLNWYQLLMFYWFAEVRGIKSYHASFLYQFDNCQNEKTQGRDWRRTKYNSGDSYYVPGIFCVLSCSAVSNSATSQSEACKALLSMGFPRQEYRSRWPFPTPRDIPNPGIKSASVTLVGGFFMTVPPGKTQVFSR